MLGTNFIVAIIAFLQRWDEFTFFSARTYARETEMPMSMLECMDLYFLKD